MLKSTHIYINQHLPQTPFTTAKAYNIQANLIAMFTSAPTLHRIKPTNEPSYTNCDVKTFN